MVAAERVYARGTNRRPARLWIHPRRRPVEVSAWPERRHRQRRVIAWAVLVFARLFLGLAPLYILHLDLAKLNASTAGAAPIALVGILFTAYTSDSCRNRAWRSV